MRSATAGPVVLLAAVLAACGGTSPTTAVATPIAITTPSASVPTSSPPAGATTAVVWTVTVGNAIQVRTNLGGTFHAVASLPGTAAVVAAGGHMLLADYRDDRLHTVNLITGKNVVRTGPAMHLGGAFSPDDTRIAYATASLTQSELDVMNLATGSVTVVKHYVGATVPVPTVWTTRGITAYLAVAYTESAPSAPELLNPTTGQVIVQTPTDDNAVIFANDGIHGADVTSSGGDAPSLDTLRTFSLGSAPRTLTKEPAHQITALAVSPNGSTVVTFDDSAAGGYAGVTASEDFGLIVWNNGKKTQLAGYGDRWDAATYADASTYYALRHSGGSEMVVKITGTSQATVDTVTGDGPVGVFAVSGS